MNVTHHQFCSSTNCCFTGEDPRRPSAYMSKQKCIPKYTDIDTAKCAHKDQREQGVWTCILMMSQSFDSLSENKLERGLGNLNSCFIKWTRGEKKKFSLALGSDFLSCSMISLVNAVGTPHPQAQRACLQTSWICCLFCEKNYFSIIN